jgi:uncharacterized protein (DUF1697 family)
MPRYIALLRGINVGGNKKVPMAALRTVLEGLGCTGVATLLQSGNAVLTSKEKSAPRVAAQIEKAILAEVGFDVSVVIRTRDEWADVIRRNPMPGAEKDASRFVVFALSKAPDPKRIAELDAKKYLPDEMVFSGRELYVRFPKGMGRSKLFTLLSGPKLGVVATARNWRTVTKLLALADVD